MLRECRAHGYFRNERCPVCSDKGKFLMNDEEINRLGRMMAGILRHFPDRFDVEMDERGWVDIHEMVNAIRRKRNQFHWLRRHHVEGVVDTDDKGRYQIEGNDIRATYAHSLKLDLDLPTDDIPEHLYYPATEEECDIMLEMGIKPADRAMVHLSKTVDSAITAAAHRVSDPMILEIDTEGTVEDGHEIMKAGNTVYITDEVPPEHLRKMGKEEMEEMSTGDEDAEEMSTGDEDAEEMSTGDEDDGEDAEEE